MSQNLNSAVAVIGIDIGKNCGQIEARLTNLPPCLIGMEACVGAHHLSRKLKAFGHDCQADAGEVCTAIFQGTEERLPRCAG